MRGLVLIGGSAAFKGAPRALMDRTISCRSPMLRAGRVREILVSRSRCAGGFDRRGTAQCSDLARHFLLSARPRTALGSDEYVRNCPGM
jgi:hypothetical protein